MHCFGGFYFIGQVIKKKKASENNLQGFCGADGTRTRDPRRDRPVF